MIHPRFASSFIYVCMYEIHRHAVTPSIITKVTGFGLLPRPSLGHTSFRIKEKPHNRHNMKWEEIPFLHTDIDKIIKIL